MSILTDVRVSLRTLRSRPAAPAIAALTIALVVGAGSAVLAVISATFVRPLPYRDEARVVTVFGQPPGSTNPRNGTPLHSPVFVRLRERAQRLDVAGIWPRDRALLRDEEPQIIKAAGITANYFQVLGVPLAAGRMFTDEEDAGNARVAVVSASFASRALGDAAPVGRSLILDGEPHQIVGVLPAVTERNYLGVDVYTPLAIRRGNEPLPTSTIVSAVGRLQPDADLAQAVTEVEAELERARTEFPAILKGWGMTAAPIRESLFGSTRPALTVLFLAVTLLVAIACANLANVTIADMAGRRDEITLRTALGATRAALVRLVTVEHAIVAVIGGAVGLVAAHAALPAILALDPDAADALGEVTIDWRVQAGAIVLAINISGLSGVLPALAATRGDLARGLAQASRRTAGSRRQARTRALLVAGETVIATVLVLASAVLLGGFNRAAAVPPGFDPSNVVAAQVRLPSGRYPDHAARAAFVRRMLDEVQSVPGVDTASAATNPLQPGSGFLTAIAAEGQPTADGQPRTMQFRRASPDYFRTLRIPVLQGRVFERTDTETSQLVSVISRQMAEEIWKDQDPIGRRFARAADPAKVFTVVGVVDDVRDRGLDTPLAPTFYLPYEQNTNAAAAITLMVRTSGPPAALTKDIARAVHRVDPILPLSAVTSLDDYLRESLGPARFRSVLLLLFAGLGLLLAVVGIYGVTARGVTERTREMGIRLALGSSRGALWRMVFGQAMAAVGIGLAIGLPIAVLGVSLLAQSVAGTSMADLWRAVPSVAVLALGGGLAAGLPTIRASRVDPLIAMRSDG